MKSKVLVIINDFFPNKQGETFLEAESQYYGDFEKVFICPIWAQNIKRDYSIPLNDNVEVIEKSLPYNFIKKIHILLRLLVFPEFYYEIINLFKTKRFTRNNLRTLIDFSKKGINISISLKKQLEEYIRQYDKKDEIIVYAYWMHINSFVAINIKQWLSKNFKTKCICRGHRFDIYEYAQPGNYIPYRRYILKKMDRVFPISEDAKKYLLDSYPEYEYKMHVSRLGTKDYGIVEVKKSNHLRIVSCSWMRPVKRVELIVEALKYLDFPVCWTHYGDGEEMGKIKGKIKEINSVNKVCILKGAVPNYKVLEDYKNIPYDVFINVSASEGVPVSIMEAMSFGLPIIATDVGGTKEIIDHGVNGFLLPKDIDAKMVAETLRKIYLLDQSNYERMRIYSREKWETLCDAHITYMDFLSNI